jgi:hypothetical protein
MWVWQFLSFGVIITGIQKNEELIIISIGISITWTEELNIFSACMTHIKPG